MQMQKIPVPLRSTGVGGGNPRDRQDGGTDLTGDFAGLLFAANAAVPAPRPEAPHPTPNRPEAVPDTEPGARTRRTMEPTRRDSSDARTERNRPPVERESRVPTGKPESSIPTPSDEAQASGQASAETVASAPERESVAGVESAPATPTDESIGLADAAVLAASLEAAAAELNSPGVAEAEGAPDGLPAIAAVVAETVPTDAAPELALPVPGSANATAASEVGDSEPATVTEPVSPLTTAVANAGATDETDATLIPLAAAGDAEASSGSEDAPEAAIAPIGMEDAGLSVGAQTRLTQATTTLPTPVAMAAPVAVNENPDAGAALEPVRSATDSPSRQDSPTGLPTDASRSTASTESARRPFHVDPATAASRMETIERIASATRATLSKGETRVRMLLNPPQLGSLRIDLSVKDGVLDASLRAETQAARHVLTSNIDSLRDALTAQGLVLGRLDVSVQDQASQDPSRRKGDDDAARAGKDRSEAIGAVDREDPDAARRRMSASRHRVDVVV